MMADLLAAVRRVFSRPGFTIPAALTLALGIGTATSIFSLVDAVLLRPPDWAASGRLVSIYAVLPERRSNPAFADTWNRVQISWRGWQELQKSSVFQEVGVWFRYRWLFGDPAQDTVEVWYASHKLLTLVGASPALGRLFTSDEDYDLSSDAVIITHECWTRRYGAKPDILGEKAFLSIVPGEGVVKTIVGVLRPGFRFRGEPPEFILPMGLRASLANYDDPAHYAVGLLATGVSLERARAEAGPIVINSIRLDSERGARIVPVAEDITGRAAQPLWLLLVGAGLLLAIACANVAGLLLGDAQTRVREVAVRIALGCSRRRVVRQLLMENTVLAVVSTSAGLILAVWLTPTVMMIAPDELSRLGQVTVDLRIAAFAAIVGIGTIAAFGVPASAFLAGSNLAPALSLATAHSTPRRSRWQRLIVTVELSLAIVLIVTATLFAETIYRLTSRPIGFDPARLIVASVRFTQLPTITPTSQIVAQGGPAINMRWVHMAGLLERLGTLPGVVIAAGVGAAPFREEWRSTLVRVRGYGRPLDEDQPVQTQAVTENYFRALGLRMISGRGFEVADRPIPASRHIRVIISKELERRTFVDNATGQRLVRDLPDGEAPIVYEVVGVVDNVKQRDFADEDAAIVYVLYSQPTSISDLIIRVSDDSPASFLTLRQAIRDYDPNILVTSTTAMNTLLARSIAEERFRAALSTWFGVAAIVLSVVGLYSVALRHVAERRREIAVRIAVGASPGRIRRLVIWDAAISVAVGGAIGLPVAVAVGYSVRTMLFDVSPAAPHVLVLSLLALAAPSVLAMLLPADKATRIDPAIALKE